MSNPPPSFLLPSPYDSRARSRLLAQGNPFQPSPQHLEMEASMLAEGGTAAPSLFSGPFAPSAVGGARPAGARPARASITPSEFMLQDFLTRGGMSGGSGSSSNQHQQGSAITYDGAQASPLGEDGHVSQSDSISAADHTIVAPFMPASSSAQKPKAKKQVINSTLMFRNPLPIATVIVHGSKFAVHAELLCRESSYFVGCLRGSFAEAVSQAVEIDDEDISAEDFGLWVDLLYRVHFNKPGTFVLRKEETGGTLSTMQLLTLWKLSDRFLNKPLATVVEESLQHRLGLYSAEQWRKLYRTRPTQDIKARVSRLQDAYRYCCEQSLPFASAIVSACANCPAQVYDSSVAILDKDFMEAVSRRMIMAHADSSLLSKEQRTASMPMMGGDYVMGGTTNSGSGNAAGRGSGAGSGAAAGRAAGGIGSL